MVKNQQISPKLSERFSDLFGVDEPAKEITSESGPTFLYIEESRKLGLNKLLHLAPYSEVLLLLGEQAVGRTTLLKAFVERAATTWRISFISANALMDGETFLRQIATGFKLEVEDINSIDGLLWEINRYLQALGRTGRRAIIIIDDAHLLTDDVILLAEKILRDERTDNCVSLVMSMRKEQGSKLDRFALLKERLAYTLEVEPFSRKEVEGYLRQRLQGTVGDPAAVLTPELVDEVLRKSGGIPEEINAEAHALLAQVKKSGTSPVGSRSLLKGALVVVLAGVVSAVLYFQDEINQMLAVSEQVTEDAGGEPVADQGVESGAAVSEQLALLTAEPTSEEGAVPMPLEDAAGQPVPVVHLDEELDEPPVQAGEISAEFAAPETLEVEVIPLEEPQVAAPVEIAEPAPAVVAEIKPEPRPEPKPEPKPKLSPQMEWLMGQPGDHYTMQMMALVDKAKVERFVKRHKLGDQGATFPITRRGKVLTVLVYGSYPNRAAADKAAKALPKSWGVQPWLRKFSSVREDVAKK